MILEKCKKCTSHIMHYRDTIICSYHDSFESLGLVDVFDSCDVVQCPRDYMPSFEENEKILESILTAV